MRQLAIWAAFGIGYEAVRTLADDRPGVAFANAGRIVALEQRLGGLFELDLQQWALGTGGALVHLADWTYWLSQFVALGAGLVWIYVWRNHAYATLRNALFIVNTLGLVGYLALPTAPPRLLTGFGFVDTVSKASLPFSSGVVKTLANPYAAMPSLHAADALVLGVALAAAVEARPLRGAFLLWPVWVWFSVLATGNHFWLDVVGGVALAALGMGFEHFAHRCRPGSARRTSSILEVNRPTGLRYHGTARSTPSSSAGNRRPSS